MADTYTTNLNLKKPGYDSPADIADINANMDKIDTSVNQLSQQKADKISLLWQNGAPSSSFEAQVIPEDQLSLDGWNKIIIVFDSVAGREVYCSAFMDLKVASCETFTIDKNGKFLSRKMLKTGNKLQFVQAYKYETYGEYAADSSVMIPCYIYGIKGVAE